MKTNAIPFNCTLELPAGSEANGTLPMDPMITATRENGVIYTRGVVFIPADAGFIPPTGEEVTLLAPVHALEENVLALLVSFNMPLPRSYNQVQPWYFDFEFSDNDTEAIEYVEVRLHNSDPTTSRGTKTTVQKVSEGGK